LDKFPPLTRVKLKYGRDKVAISLPDQQVMGIYSPAGKRAVKNLGKAVINALKRPVGAKPLGRLVLRGIKSSLKVS
jgi:hypothetical protein